MRAPALLLLAALASTAPGRGQITMSVDGDPASGREVTGQIDAVFGGQRPGGFGYATIRLTNRDVMTHQVHLDIETSSWSRIPFSCQRTLQLQPGETTRTTLPLPSGQPSRGTLRARIEGAPEVWRSDLQLAARNPGVAVLCVTDRASWAADWETRLESLAARQLSGSRSTKRYLGVWQRRGAADLPDRWQWLTAFDLIVVDGGAQQLDTGAQQMLCDVIDCGGQVIVDRPDVLPAGALRRVTERSTDGVLGFGRWLTATDQHIVESWLTPVLDRVNTNLTGPVSEFLHQHMSIPGIGDVPVRAFFIFILGFAILVGPINVAVARRRRKPLMMLITVPAAGITCTLILLTFGVFSEGFGIHGVIHSLSILDQRQHQAVSMSSRTLYAGLSPAHLATDPGTYLYSTDLESTRHEVHTHSLDLDLDRSRIAGTALPSRWPTSIVTVSKGPCRERIRFRHREDGGVELLAGPGLRPVAGGGTVLLCDHRERYLRNQADGSMKEVDAAAVPKFIAKLTERCRSLHANQDLGRANPVRAALRLQIQKLRPVPGTYLALVESMPAVDNLGLEVDYARQVHLVQGLLGEEDIIE